MILVIEDYDGLYSPFWAHLGETTTKRELLFTEPDLIQLVCFTGGEDISPELYGHENLGSHCSRTRDEHEVLAFQMARKHKIPMTGICRGSQFLNVMCGGTMVQNLKRSHGGGRHQCQTYDGREFTVTSSHHQMSVPGHGGSCLAQAGLTLDPQDLLYGGSFADLAELYTEEGQIKVVEAFAYPRVNIFAVQHHPEWQSIEEEAPQWTLRKIRELCWNEEETVLQTT